MNFVRETHFLNSMGIKLAIGFALYLLYFLTENIWCNYTMRAKILHVRQFDINSVPNICASCNCLSFNSPFSVFHHHFLFSSSPHSFITVGDFYINPKNFLSRPSWATYILYHPMMITLRLLLLRAKNIKNIYSPEVCTIKIIYIFRIRSKTSEGKWSSKCMNFIFCIQRIFKNPEHYWEICGTTSLDCSK